MKILIAFTVLTLSFQCLQSQKIYQSHIMYVPNQTGFIYCKGISWIENKKQDSVLSIVIEGDTMTAVRNLLVYCLQIKSEIDNASVLLSIINLDHLKSMFKDKTFDFYLKEYRKSVTHNEIAWKNGYKTY